jgi:hypothetical protein
MVPAKAKRLFSPMASQQDLQPKKFDYDLKTEPAPLPVPGVYKFT